MPSRKNAYDKLNKTKTKMTKIDETRVATYGDTDFRYDPEAPVKCNFSMVLDHILWLKFCEASEELGTSPTILMYKLMEKFLMVLGKINPNFTSTDPAPVGITVEDLQKTKPSDKFFNMGVNPLLHGKTAKPSKKRKSKYQHVDNEDDGDEEFDLSDVGI